MNREERKYLIWALIVVGVICAISFVLGLYGLKL